MGTKVVGMGGEVSSEPYTDPSPLVGTIPPAKVVFHGVEVNDRIYAEAYRNAELGTTLVNQTGYVICIPK